MKTMTVRMITGWRAVLAWLAIAVVIITYWEVGKAIGRSLNQWAKNTNT